MFRFCVAILVLCAASLLTLQLFVSLQPSDVQASSHSGCADTTTDQTFSALPDGSPVHGCNGSVAFSSAGSLCTAGWHVGDVVNDNGLNAVLSNTAASANRWIYMNGDPGSLLGIGSTIACWGAKDPCGSFFTPVPNVSRPVHGTSLDLFYYNGSAIPVLANKGNPSTSSSGAICVGTPPAPSVTITSPAAGSWLKSPFPVVGYTTANANLCVPYTNNNGAGWIQRPYGPGNCASPGTLTMDIVNWCPTQGINVCEVRITANSSLVVNGDFQTADPTPPVAGTYIAPDSPPGWTVESGSIDLGAYAPTGPAFSSIDLSGYGPGTIYQDIPTQAGKTYTLRFAMGGNAYNKTFPEPSVKQVQIWWDGSIVGTFSFDTLGFTREGWDIHTFNVIATGSTTRLKFESLTPTAFGPLLDDIHLIDPLAVGAQDEEYFSIDLTAPTVMSFTATDGTTTVDSTTDPLLTGAGSITLNWAAPDNAGGSGIEHHELWRTPDAGGVPDHSLWNKVGSSIPSTTTSILDSPGSGGWWYGLHVFDNVDNCINETGGHTCGGVLSDGQDPRTPVGPILVVINEAPQVDAGGNENTDFSGAIALDGTVTDDGLPSGTLTISWTKISGPGNVTFANPSSADTTVTFTAPGVYVLRLTADDGQLSAFEEISITPPPHGLVPCGVDRNNPDTPWNETEDCALRHTFLLIKNLIDFTLWKLVPLIVVIMVVATGAIFYFSWGSANTLATVRRIWRYIGMGVLILMFSWLFLNFFLGILGFDINVFGRWTEITV